VLIICLDFCGTALRLNHFMTAEEWKKAEKKKKEKIEKELM
jgi:hypothetical protein